MRMGFFVEIQKRYFYLKIFILNDVKAPILALSFRRNLSRKINSLTFL